MSGLFDDAITRQNLEAQISRIEDLANTLLQEALTFRAMLTLAPAAALEPVAPKKEHTIKELLTYFDTKHREKFKAPALIHGGKDATIAKRLLAKYDMVALQGMVNEFFDRDDDWTVRVGYTMGTFEKAVPGLIAISNGTRRTSGVTRNTEENRSSAKAGADLIRRTVNGDDRRR